KHIHHVVNRIVPKSQFQTNISLGYCFPCEVWNTHISLCPPKAVYKRRFGAPVVITGVDDGGDIRKPVCPDIGTQYAIARLADRSAEFQVRNDTTQGFHERFFRYNPTQCHSREETEAFSFGKVF